MTAYLIHYKGIVEDAKVLKFSEKSAAQVHRLPHERSAIVIAQEADLASIGLTGAMLVRMYNAFADKPVVKFETRQIGQERFFRLIEEKFGGAALSDEPTEKEPEDMAGKKKATPAEPKRGRKSKLDPGWKLRKLVDENPRRKGTHGFKSFSVIRNGMTVKAYLEAGGRPNDLVWDVAHKYVELEKA